MENKEMLKPDQESKEVLKEASKFNTEEYALGNSKVETNKEPVKSVKSVFDDDSYERERKSRQNLKFSIIILLDSLKRLLTSGIDVIREVM